MSILSSRKKQKRDIANSKLSQRLVAFGSPEAKQVSMLRSDIRSEIAKENGQSNGGGDFHVPFWSDAKSYVLNGTDLASRTETRVASNKQRKRLYPSLHDGFIGIQLDETKAHRHCRSLGFIV